MAKSEEEQAREDSAKRILESGGDRFVQTEEDVSMFDEDDDEEEGGDDEKELVEA